MTAVELDSLSVVFLYSALVVYAAAFVVSVVTVGARGRVSGEHVPRSVRALDRVSTALLIIAFAVHAAAVVLRGIAAERAPWGNMYEFAISGTAIIVGVYLLAIVWRDVRFLSAYIAGMVTILLALAALNLYVPIAPLQPALQSIWLVIHVFVAIVATGLFAVGAGISVTQMFRDRRERGGLVRSTYLDVLPSAEVLEVWASRVVIIGFALWTFTLMAGAIWAERAWGRYWGWDPKEVWTFIIWVVYAGYIHARATRGWRGNRAAWLSLIGFAAVLFNFTIVNTLFKGLHAYSGL